MALNLKDRDWHEFFLKDIFSDVQRGKRLIKSNQLSGKKPYVSSTALNNGVDNFIGNETGVRVFSDCLTIANSGSVGASFYQPYEFVASDHITHLKNIQFNSFIYLFIGVQTTRFSEKYNFNLEINDRRISREKIMLPVTDKGQPDWDFIEQYSKDILETKNSEYFDYCRKELANLKYKDIEALENIEWGEFFIEDIAEIVSGKDIYEAERIYGETPYISSTAQNNGIGHFVGNINGTLEKNCLSVNRNGSVGYSFYHPYEGLFSNDCRKLRPKYKSKYVGFFLSNQIARQREKYNYGYKMGTARLKRQKIMLPVNKLGEPDYNYMEQYMINLEYKKRKNYLDFKRCMTESSNHD